MPVRSFLKKIIHWWPWPLTLNERYDRQTKSILKKVCQPDSICVDIGCFKGDILKAMIDHAPKARHYAFEPIPEQYHYLQEHFGDKAVIYPYAVGHENKQTEFNYVVSNPTYSGLRQRQYKKEEDIKVIGVQVRKLDDLIPPDAKIHLIKIDVEGGEYDVLQGAARILQQHHPYLIFEHGIGGSDRYGVKPEDLYQLLVERFGYKISLMGDFLKITQDPYLTQSDFENQYHAGTNCYFIASMT